MKLTLSLMKNENLLQKFPKDPDYDVIIICGDSKFKLQIAFLYLESKYFDDMYHQNQKEIELHHLDQQALEKVLMLLYGGEITIKTFEHFSKIFTVVTFLKIESLRDIIIELLKEQMEKLNSIELLEFAYHHNVLVNEISVMNLSNDLEILRDPKYSMELNKISEKSLNLVLLEYYHKCRNSENEQSIKSNINGILSDYFHTNKLRAEDYFANHNVDILQCIWCEFHPVYYSLDMHGSNSSNRSQLTKTIQDLEQKIKNLKLVAVEKGKKIQQMVLANEKIAEKLKKKKKPAHSRTITQPPLLIPKYTINEPMNKPPSIPISPTSNYNMLFNQNRSEYIQEDDESHLNKLNNMNQMKAKQGVNRIHTRNNSRGRE